MAFSLKPKKDFLKYINEDFKRYPFKNSYEEELIEKFDSSNLSDLYKLFSNLKDITLPTKLYNKFKEKISNLFPDNANIKGIIMPKENNSESTNSVHYKITQKQLDSLGNAIKEKYLSYVQEKEKIDITDEELYNLSLIVNKLYPSVFLKLIESNKNKKNANTKKRNANVKEENADIEEENTNIKEAQKLIVDKILSTINHYCMHLPSSYSKLDKPSKTDKSSEIDEPSKSGKPSEADKPSEAEEENKDIAAAIWITAKDLYPDLDIYIPGRIKSTKSTLCNLKKEIYKNLENLMPSDPSKGLSIEDIKNFDLKGANNDFSGLTIVLSNTDDVLHFDKNDPNSKEILSLRKERTSNLSFIHSIENFLQEKIFGAEQDENLSLSTSDLLQIEIEILNRLRKLTFDECTKEYKDTSFNELLRKALKKYKSSNVDELNDTNNADYEKSLNNIYDLIDELKKRVHDKYQLKLLEITVPEILKSDIITKDLGIIYKPCKYVKKPNGFVSQYYSLKTPGGRIIELQATSKERYRESKIGSAPHSKLPNKSIDIFQFFEPVEPQEINGEKQNKISEEEFKSLISVLDSTYITTRNALYNTKNSELSPKDRSLKIKLQVAEQNVKIKDKITFDNPPGEPIVVDTDEYLKLFAEYVSPTLMSISSSHTRFLKSVVAYDKKSLVSCFNEVLLKNDRTSCLAQQLIDRLESIIPNDISEVSLNGIKLRATERKSKINSSNGSSNKNEVSNKCKDCPSVKENSSNGNIQSDLDER